MGDTILQILFIAVLVVVNGYFSAAEIALISVRRASLKKRAAEGSKGARAALALTEEPTRLLATIQVGITLVGMLASAAAAVSLAKPVAVWLRGSGFPWLASAASWLSVLLITLVVSYVTLIFGELVPKRIGLHGAEKVAVSVALPVAWLATVSAPVVWFLSVSTGAVARLIGMKSDGGRPGVSEEEIKLLVTEQGSLLEEEKRMIHEIFELGDTVAREIMVPRVDMVLAEDTLTVREVVSLMRGTGYSRVPVFHDDRDRVVGIALLMDLAGPLGENKGGDPVTDHLREPVFVPETKGILPLLSEMQTHRNQVVVVVDEYGGTAGLVTVEDIVEEVVGEIADEFDRDLRFITAIGPGEWVIDGRLPIEDALALGLPVDESDEYETLAGWLLTRLGHIPIAGERYASEGYEFHVQTMRRRRVARLHVSAPKTPKPESTEGADV
ncbi:MAG: HlyC/CorC family transporter [Actinobacteria bacterium HGW-Actinobacteria-7]|jgi:putative hemolysin|nr:MAG: HlyC/CorC family transporter [Actinobacteria bacterium HGW-Actinobacteria-7]